MTLFQGIILGIVQGLGEFLPISSSAHLILVPWLLRWDDGGLTFDVALHAGTLVSLLIYFRREWVLFLKALTKIRPRHLKLKIHGESDPYPSLAVFIIAATI